tara:strand:- start:209 stop:376 length:168 start_codon:yes stop_codon:yes gene_type:complete
MTVLGETLANQNVALGQFSCPEPRRYGQQSALTLDKDTPVAAILLRGPTLGTAHQ